jgi:hypothetical protein
VFAPYSPYKNQSARASIPFPAPLYKQLHPVQCPQESFEGLELRLGRRVKSEDATFFPECLEGYNLYPQGTYWFHLMRKGLRSMYTSRLRTRKIHYGPRLPRIDCHSAQNPNFAPTSQKLARQNPSLLNNHCEPTFVSAKHQYFWE